MRIRNLILAVSLCFAVSPARAYDSSKPWIYSMRFMMDTWGYLEMYSTATVVSKSDNFAAFRVVTSTTNPTYQMLVTTQGNVGIGTANPAQKLEVAGTVHSTSGGFKFPDGTTQTSAVSSSSTLPSGAQTGDLLYYDGTGWTKLSGPTASGQYLKSGWDSYTKLLLHMDGSDGSQTFTDTAAGKSVSANGNAQIDAAQYKFGGASGLFDGSGDYLSLSDSDDWNFGSGDFTIDFWVRFNSLTTNYFASVFFQQYVGAVAQVWFGHTNAGTLYFWSSTGSPPVHTSNYSLTWSPALNTWYHLAAVRNGSNFYIFINGASQTLTVGTPIGTNTLPDVGAALDVGRYHDSGGDGYFNGWFDEYRISKGVARWTSNFTPPSSAHAPSISWQ